MPGHRQAPGVLIGTRSLNVGPSRQYSTIQAAVLAAEALAPAYGSGIVIEVDPGTYSEDVSIIKSDIFMMGNPGQGGVFIRSVTVTNATRASLALFNVSGNFADLVADSVDGPKNTQFRDVQIERSAGPAWAANARGSLRLIGVGAGTAFLGQEDLAWTSTIRPDYQGSRSVLAVLANYVSFFGCWIPGLIETRQVSGLWMDFCNATDITTAYDTADPLGEPSDNGNYGVNLDNVMARGTLTVNGPQGRFGQDYFRAATINAITTNATAVNASTADDSHCVGNVTITNAAGPTITWNGGWVAGTIAGAGAASFTFSLIKTAQLATGTADNATYLRGDQTWASLASIASSLSWGNRDVGSSTTTRYLSPGFDSGLAPTAPVQVAVPRDGVARNLTVRHNSPAGNGNNIVYTLRVNGVPTALTVTLASTGVTATDAVNTVNIVQGDLLDIEVTKALAIGSGILNATAVISF